MSLPPPGPDDDERERSSIAAEERPRDPGHGHPRRRSLLDGVPVIATLKEAYRLVRANPRAVLLPVACIYVPLAIAISGTQAVLFLTVWSDQDLAGLINLTDFEDIERSVLFVLLVLAAAEVLFLWGVARGAAVVAVAGVIGGRAPTLTEALDPAFTRIGGLLALIAVFLGIFTGALLTGIGVLLLPYLVLRLGLSFDAYMIEGLSPWRSLARSWDLMGGNILRFFALSFLAALCALPLFILVSLPGAAIGGSRTVEILLLAAYSVLQSAALVPVVVFFTACTTLYYFKTRAIRDATSVA